MSSPQKLVRFDWAVKKLLRNKANFDILERESNQEYELDKFKRVDKIKNIFSVNLAYFDLGKG